MCYTHYVAWSVEYYDTRVEQAVLQLPPGLLARYLRLAELLMEFGPNLGMPHTRAMGDRLIELRVRGSEGIARAFYCAVGGQRIVMLHVIIKKSQKTPRRELETAKRRLREVLNREPH